MSNTYLTPDEAAQEWLCPLGRAHGSAEVTSTCRGSACAVWRWKPRLSSDPDFVAAVKREMACLAQEDGRNKPAVSFHKQASQRVGRNPEDYGLNPTHGFCGLGGAVA